MKDTGISVEIKITSHLSKKYVTKRKKMRQAMKMTTIIPIVIYGRWEITSQRKSLIIKKYHICA